MDEKNHPAVQGNGEPIQWHPPFYAAMRLELREDRTHLKFYEEFNINSKPNEIDLLVIHSEDAKTKSGLGAIFRKHNLIEYRSPEDSLNDSIYYRTLGYANLYIHYGKEVSPEDVTISFVREMRPRILMERLRREGYDISEFEKGIYHVTKPYHFDMQIIVLRELDPLKYLWVTRLSTTL